MDQRLQPALLSLAPGLLQPPVLPDGHHAEHGQEERAAAGQDVSHLRGDQEELRGGPADPEGGRLHTRPLHGGKPCPCIHCSVVIISNYQGARWDMNIGSIAESQLKELYPTMPVMYIKAITQDKQETRNLYECPVYKTRQRGPTYIWTFNLRTKERPSKWVLAGVSLLLQI